MTRLARLRPVAGSTVVAVTVAALASGVVRAHDVTGSRFDAPVPLSLLFVGAAATVAVTAGWVAATDRSSTVRVGPWPLATIGSREVSVVRIAIAGLFGAGVLVAVADGIVGRQVAAENLATVFTWPVWFRGLALVAVVVGSPWPLVSPWRTVYRGLCRLEGGTVSVFEYPERLGAWPALIGFLVLIGVIENLTVIPRSPRLTTVVVAAYGMVMIGGAALFGPRWFDRADPLGVLYRLFGRVAPITVRRADNGGRTVLLCPPWQDCRRPVSGVAIVTFVVAAVYTVSFDGFTDTALYQTLLFGVRDGLGTGPPTSVPLYLVGLAAFVAAFVAASRTSDAFATSPPDLEEVTADGGATPDATTPQLSVGDHRWRPPSLAFAPTLLPVAAAYDVAHNYPYVIRSTGRLADLLIGGVGEAVGTLDPLWWLPLPVFWASQVLLIVLGHVLAVVAAHRVALDRYASVRAARRGHLPIAVLMIGYTVVSLWIVSQPIVS
jgi:hypothetical protein